MTITIEYEAEKQLDLPYEDIIRDVVNESLDYEKCPYEAEVNVILTDNQAIQEINREHRQIDAPTDVLSFPMVDYEAPSDFDHVEDAVEDYFNPETGELMLGEHMGFFGVAGILCILAAIVVLNGRTGRRAYERKTSGAYPDPCESGGVDDGKTAVPPASHFGAQCEELYRGNKLF